MKQLRSRFLQAAARGARKCLLFAGAMAIASPTQAAIVGYWGLDEIMNPSSGTTALDYSGNGANGVYQPLGGVGGPIVGVPGATPDTGTAANFNGTTDEVFLGNPNGLHLTNNFTIAAWIKPDVTTAGATQRILSQNTGVGGTGYGFGLLGSELKFTTYGKLDYQGDANDAFTVPTGVWTHVAAVMGTDNSVTFYQNGRFVRRITGTQPAGANPGSLNYFLGTTAGANAERFDGAIDDVQVYNTALTQAEVQTVFGLPQTPTLLGHWKLDETVNPSGSTIALDSSGNGRDGKYQPLSGVNAGPDVGLPGAPTLGGTAADFDGTADEVFLASPLALRQKNDFTIMAWINPDSVSDPGKTQRIFSQAGGGYGFGIIGGELKFTTYGIKDYQGNVADGASVEAGKWTHVAVVFDDGNDARFYINGAFVEEIDGLSPANTVTGNFFLGSTGTGERFGGLLDDVRFYQGSLTADQILQAAAIPEPSTFVLGGFGVVALVGLQRRRRK